MESTQSSTRSGASGGRPVPGMGGSMQSGRGGDENIEIKAQREDVDSMEQLNQSNRNLAGGASDAQARRTVEDSEPMDVMVQREDIDDNLRDRTDIPRQSQSGMQQAMAGMASSQGSTASGQGSQEMSKFRADLDDFIARIPGMSGMDLNAAKEKLLSSLSSSRETAMNYANEAKQQLNQKVEATNEYVREKPMQSIGIAAGVGFLLGLLVSRR